MKKIIRPLIVLMISIIIVFSSCFIQVFAHDSTLIVYSQWSISEHSIEGSFDIYSTLLNEISLAKVSNIDFDSLSPASLKESVGKILQPYVDTRLNVWINNEKHTVRVKEITQNEYSLNKMSLSVDNVSLDKNKEYTIKFEYSMFFKETQDSHVNVAEFTSPSFEVSTNQHVFDSSQPTAEVSLTKLLSPKENKEQKKASSSFWGNIGDFIKLGIEHILTGYDHILFLVALVVIGLSLKEVLKIVTSFTIAHSITLLLAALQIVRLNPKLVESVIALSICYVAAENILKKESKYRWLVTFGFGLIHGFGFASILDDFNMEKTKLVYSVISFNIGVEIGQLMIFSVMLPILYLLKKKLEFKKVTIGISVCVFVLGFIWLIERLFDLKILGI